MGIKRKMIIFNNYAYVQMNKKIKKIKIKNR